MTKNLILAIDQGTTGTTALLVNKNLKVLASKNIEFRQIYPKPGWVEHNLNDIWNSTLKAIKGVLTGKKSLVNQIAAIGITNQRETSCFWSKKSGKPLCNAIVWQDRRTAEYCDSLKKSGKEVFIQTRTGLLLDPYFSASKISWALKNNLQVKAAAEKEDCAFGTIDSYLVHKLTSGQSHVTEPSNASRTMLFNLQNAFWDDDLLKLFEIPTHILPKVLSSTDLFGLTKNIPGLPNGIPIHGILGDQQSALLGQACLDEGTAKCTYGTGSFILLNTGKKIIKSKHRLLSTIAWKIENEITYALEGGAFTAGASVQWLRDGLQMFKKSSEVEPLAKTVQSSDGVIFVPAFAGIGAPHWLPNARASFFGITRGTQRGHLARAVLEGIALMNNDILIAMENDLGERLKSLNVDGGAASNNLLMQFQSDILRCSLIRPKLIETTALGAVFAAGLGVGIWKNLSDIKKSWKKDKIFNPSMQEDARLEFIKKWNWAISKLK